MFMQFRRWIRGGAAALIALNFLSAHAQVILSQPPVVGGGVMRTSKLWVDPSPAGNNLDGDAIVYEGFTLSSQATIRHMDWWGSGYSEQGFQIEFWKQDPGTVAYQPYGVFRESGAQPEAAFTTTSYSSIADQGITKYSVDLTTPITLSANSASNPRWFVAVIGLTSVPYAPWDWAQSNASDKSFWFIRGGSLAGGDWYTLLRDGRAVDLVGAPVPESSSVFALGLGVVAIAIPRRRKR